MDLPLTRDEYREMRRHLTDAVHELLVNQKGYVDAVVADMLTFLRSHCAECAAPLGDCRDGQCRKCGATQPWALN